MHQFKERKVIAVTLDSQCQQLVFKSSDGIYYEFIVMDVEMDGG